MKFFIAAAQNTLFPRYFPEKILSQLREMGEVELNPHDRPMTREELARALADTDILITHWGTPQVDAEMLAHAPRLKLLAHAAGTVAHIASEACYAQGIPVLSANPIMAKYVAENVLCDLLAMMHTVPQHDDALRQGCWDKRYDQQHTLFGAKIGVIGMGAVARNLMALLRPFGCSVAVYDPFLPENGLAQWDFCRRVSFEEAMGQPIVSIHAAQTPETFHLINARALSLMPDGGILVNTARGSLVDTDALIAELQTGRISAVLDVYEQEGAGRQPQALLDCRENTMLQPHAGATAVTWEMTQGIVDDVRRFQAGQPLQLRVSLAQYRLMTQE